MSDEPIEIPFVGGPMNGEHSLSSGHLNGHPDDGLKCDIPGPGAVARYHYSVAQAAWVFDQLLTFKEAGMIPVHEMN